MAAHLLKGQSKASETPVYLVKNCTPVYNDAVLKQLGLSLPAEYANAQAVSK